MRELTAQSDSTALSSDIRNDLRNLNTPIIIIGTICWECTCATNVIGPSFTLTANVEMDNNADIVMAYPTEA